MSEMFVTFRMPSFVWLTTQTHKSWRACSRLSLVLLVELAALLLLPDPLPLPIITAVQPPKPPGRR